jgi:hypothetical protein
LKHLIGAVVSSALLVLKWISATKYQVKTGKNVEKYVLRRGDGARIAAAGYLNARDLVRKRERA